MDIPNHIRPFLAPPILNDSYNIQKHVCGGLVNSGALVIVVLLAKVSKNSSHKGFVPPTAATACPIQLPINYGVLRGQGTHLGSLGEWWGYTRGESVYSEGF